MLTKEAVLEALKQVYDPEIPVDIVNLGLIYEVLIDDGSVGVKMTTTAPGCPVGDFIARNAERVLSRLEGARAVHIQLVYDPPWSQEMMTEEGKRMLGIK
ncbi:MAG TPA: metal-sulfur cluster assembly factor [Methylomirabilota bacterium]|nr:metal-sulfur cluster assembly factor [Methylomirabilota bacterium]